MLHQPRPSRWRAQHPHRPSRCHPPPTQPLAGTAFAQTQPRQTEPLVLQAAPLQTQPLAGDAHGDDSDDNDYEGLDSRAAVGEQSFEEETAQAEEAGSEAEEIAFKLKVAAVVRVHGRAKRYGKEPYQKVPPSRRWRGWRGS